MDALYILNEPPDCPSIPLLFSYLVTDLQALLFLFGVVAWFLFFSSVSQNEEAWWVGDSS